MSGYQKVGFQTLDGITLRGCLYLASGDRTPAVILTSPYFFVQDFMLPEIAAYFAQQGITALIYDTCSFGESDGQPRCELDLIKQVEDYSDALSFLASYASIDPSRIGFWGISFSGTVAFDAAALDQRSRFVISVGPIVEPSGENPKPPFYVQAVASDGTNPMGFGPILGAEAYELVERVTASGMAPTCSKDITLQSFAKMLKWHPLQDVKWLGNAPMMLLVSGDDTVTPPEDQRWLFYMISGPKRMEIAPGKSFQCAG
ncbi:alpha/beta hydrolase [Aspergillus glaucus CBS 516.65]|uniref:Xaa-Pro dipeptidyl-peptidase-like domain-containing protein n=1 Tax=Aspergillus glaucus CBS 516.65 TaxID=1160497 RepID=A0A1L9VCF5_ASPGL|nr:hypothetical protein ASPGLDRAFT_37915 [Aspergillus glaucus CBS 516.65]OJJ81606.1 hypothetical protein ASPGLDRAFT_37915 [Aspergillus glaucus CBS 516.65]